jgi:hypothetical protein
MTHPLAVRVAGSGSFDLVRFNQGLNAEVIATVAGTLGTIGFQCPTRAAQIGNRLFWIANDRVYQKTGTGSVTEKLNLATGSYTRYGWLRYYMHPTNGPGLFGQTAESNSDLILYDYKTDVWSTVTAVGQGGSGTDGHTSLIVVNDVGYFVNTNYVHTVDPVAQSVSRTLTGAGPAVLNPYNDIVYILRAGTVNGAIYEFGQWIGNTFILLNSVTGSETRITSNDDGIQRTLLYQIGSDTYMAAPNDSTTANGDGWVAGKWDGAAYTDVTNTLLPAQFRPGGSLAASASNRWRFFHWKVLEGPTVRTYIQVTLNYQGTASLLYEHVGATWVLRNSSAWGNHYSYFPNPEAGGDLYYDEAELNAVKISKESAVANGMELEYYVNGDEGTADTFAALFYSKDGGGTWLRATIIAPGGGTGGGSSIASNNLQNVDADGDGLTPTTYTVIHDWTTDGLSSLDSVWWNLRCSKTAF